MSLYLANIHLNRARMFGRMKEKGGRMNEELAEARRRIEQHGYGRRYEELADAESAAGHWK